MMKEITDHDLLIRIDERTNTLSTHFCNHIRHHWMITIPLILSIVGLIITLLIK